MGFFLAYMGVLFVIYSGCYFRGLYIEHKDKFQRFKKNAPPTEPLATAIAQGGPESSQSASSGVTNSELETILCGGDDDECEHRAVHIARIIFLIFGTFLQILFVLLTIFWLMLICILVGDKMAVGEGNVFT